MSESYHQCARENSWIAFAMLCYLSSRYQDGYPMKYLTRLEQVNLKKASSSTSLSGSLWQTPTTRLPVLVCPLILTHKVPAWLSICPNAFHCLLIYGASPSPCYPTCPSQGVFHLPIVVLCLCEPSYCISVMLVRLSPRNCIRPLTPTPCCLCCICYCTGTSQRPHSRADFTE